MPPRLPCTCTAQHAPCPGCLAYAAPQDHDSAPPSRHGRTATQRALYAARKVAHQCVVCAGAVPAGRAYCAGCVTRSRQPGRQRTAQRRRQRIDAAKAQGLCPTSGCAVAVQGTVYCQTCRAHAATTTAARKARREQ